MPSGSVTVTQTHASRIFRSKAAHGPFAGRPALYGCLYRSNRARPLGGSRCAGGSGSIVEPTLLLGDLAGYGIARCGIDTRSARVRVMDLATGRLIRDEAATTSRSRPQSFAQVTSLVLRTNGTVAWILSIHSVGGRSSAVEVHAADRGRARLLASDRAIDPRSLQIDGSRIYWRLRGHRSSARLG